MMTNEEFWKLFDGGALDVKVFKGDFDGEERSVEAFEHDGHCYLRVHKVYRYLTGERRFGKRYRMTKEYHAIKEFKSKEQANAYFVKFGEGKLKRTEVY